MILVNGKYEKGMKEAAAFFPISEKGLREWIRKGRIERPPTVRQGTRILKYFPDDFLRRMKNRIEENRDDEN